jgi:ABC-type tungstate transport system, permease component
MILFAAAAVRAEERSILLQSTTSTAASGLYDHLLPVFRAAHGVRVDVVAVGTGQAIRNARNCDGDVLIVHDTRAENAFVSDGAGTARFDLMYNDFIIVGPAGDPAGIADAADAATAMRGIAAARALFASRGDDSGTHRKELGLWYAAGVVITDGAGEWYRATGSGMGATLNAAVGMGAYALTDRATWITHGNKADFRILVEGDPALFNQYGVIPLNPVACPAVRAADAKLLVDWLLSPEGQRQIAAYRVGGTAAVFSECAIDACVPCVTVV